MKRATGNRKRYKVRGEALPTQISDAAQQKRTLCLAAKTLHTDAALIVEAGFSLSERLSLDKTRFVLRGAKNFTAPKNALPVYKGKGRPPEKGEYVRPLSRAYQKKRIKATPADGSARWKEGRHTIKALLFDDRVLSEAKPGSPSLRCVVILDPRYQEPLVLVTNWPKSVSARAIWLLYKDRGPREQRP